MQLLRVDLKHKLWFSILLNFVAFLAIPTGLFTLLSRKIYMMHPVVNADYLALGIIAPWLSIPVFFVLYLVLILNELLVNIAPLYNFSIGEFLVSIQFAKFLNFSLLFERWAPIFISAVLLTVLAVWLARWGTSKLNRRTTSVALLVFAIVICSLDILNGTSFLPIPSSSSFADINFAYSGVRRTVMSFNQALVKGDAVFSPLGKDEAATSALFRSFEQPNTTSHLGSQNVVLIVVESMGKFKDAVSQELLMSHFESPSLRGRYQVKISEVPFRGSTIHGEFRELCNVKLDGYGSHLPSQCLPSLFHKHGFESIAYHGFTNQFYKRFEWYPALGFDRTYFAEDLRREGLKRSCGSSFTGICDTDVITKIREQLVRDRKNGKPKFIHWMTLNSHLPLANVEANGSLLDCSQSVVLRNDKALCTYTKLIDQVLAGVADLAQDSDITPTRFILVGDHAPPFRDPARRGMFESSVVTSIELSPRPVVVSHAPPG